MQWMSAFSIYLSLCITFWLSQWLFGMLLSRLKKNPTYFVVAEWRIIKIRLLCPSALNNHLKWKLLADTDTDIGLQTDSPLLLAVNAGRGEAFPHNWKEVPSDIICIHMIKLVPLWCFISVDTDKTAHFHQLTAYKNAAKHLTISPKHIYLQPSILLNSYPV